VIVNSARHRPMLEVRDLSVRYLHSGAVSSTLDMANAAVAGVNFSIEAGEAVGLVGESGSGKTTIALAIMGLLPADTEVAGQISFDGVDLLRLDEAGLNSYRSTKVAIAFQGAMNALNPLMRVVDQVAEPIAVHLRVKSRRARVSALELLDRVGIPGARAAGYPHEFSGGMRQRAVIAVALACQPNLLIADEPGTALDVLVQAQVLDLLKRLQKEYGLAMLVISHDLAVIEYLTTKCAVMHRGQFVESGPTSRVLTRPSADYTRHLIASDYVRASTTQAGGTQ
jgi:peptide/nickel transport system ATP-binding protein